MKASSRGNSRGFSLVEVLAATAIIALGLLALFASMAFGIRATRHGELTTQAANLNREIVELIKGNHWAFDKGQVRLLQDRPQDRHAIEAPPFDETLQKYAGGPFTRNVLVTRLSADPNDWENHLASIKVTVHWNENGKERQLTFETYDRQ